MLKFSEIKANFERHHNLWLEHSHLRNDMAANTGYVRDHYPGNSPGLYQMGHEFITLLELYIELKPRYVVEVGNAEGGTLYYWLKYASPETTVIGIDINHSMLRELDVWDGVNRDQLKLIQGDSTSLDTLIKVQELIPHIDFLFIDGDRSYPGVHVDYMHYSSFVHRGVIALHDIVPDSLEPTRYSNILWENIVREGAECIGIHTPKVDGFGIGIISRGGVIGS